MSWQAGAVDAQDMVVGAGRDELRRYGQPSLERVVAVEARFPFSRLNTADERPDAESERGGA
jgi:hypothetical protein